MDEHLFLNNQNNAPAAPTLRDLLGTLFRHRRVVVATFMVIVTAAAMAAFVLPPKYEARMKILVERERMDPLVTPSPNAEPQLHTEAVSEEDLNSEVELIKSRDLLQQVVETCGLDKADQHFWSNWADGGQKAGDIRLAKAVRKLDADLQVSPVPKTNLIEVSYTSTNPRLAARVLQTLSGDYLVKHVAVHRPKGAFGFFEKQTEQYRRQMENAETQLSKFNTQSGAVSAAEQRDQALQRATEFGATLQQTRAEIASTEKRINALESEMASTPARLTTVDRKADNAQLLEQMKSTLLKLQVQQTQLLANYDPSYRPVKEVEQQIALTKAAIASEESAPVRERDTDQNPTYQWLNEELAKAKTEMASLQAKAAATERTVAAYGAAAVNLDRKDMQQKDLMRTAQAEEGNYLLYMRKREEVRISDALDSQRIVNVAVAEVATTPTLPVHTAWVTLLVGTLLGGVVSAGAAFTADFLDPSFRTPEEVSHLLDVPLFALIPENSIPFEEPAPSSGRTDGSVNVAQSAPLEGGEAYDEKSNQTPQSKVAGARPYVS